MKILFICPNNWLGALAGSLERFGHELVKENPEIILGMSISQSKRIFAVIEKYPDCPLAIYNWDTYSYMDYNSGIWKEFGDLCRKSVDIWYPSQCTKDMTMKIYGVDKGVVIKMFVPTDWVTCAPRGDYVLLPMRFYEKDPCFDWAKRACAELNIPLVHPNHDLPLAEYREIMANCNMVVSPYAEASTGGMGMLEAAKCGKPVLANGSPLNGAREYMGDYATYFDGYEDFCDKLWRMYSTSGTQEPISRTIEDMAKEINERLCLLQLQGK